MVTENSHGVVGLRIEAGRQGRCLVLEMTEEGSLGQGCISRDGRKHQNFYVLRINLVGFPAGLCVGYKKVRSSMIEDNWPERILYLICGRLY